MKVSASGAAKEVPVQRVETINHTPWYRAQRPALFGEAFAAWGPSPGSASVAYIKR